MIRTKEDFKAEFNNLSRSMFDSEPGRLDNEDKFEVLAEVIKREAEMRAEAAAAFEGVTVGWYTDTTFATPANDVILNPGDGIAVNSGAAGTTFRVPKAL